MQKCSVSGSASGVVGGGKALEAENSCCLCLLLLLLLLLSADDAHLRLLPLLPLLQSYEKLLSVYKMVARMWASAHPSSASRAPDSQTGNWCQKMGVWMAHGSWKWVKAESLSGVREVDRFSLAVYGSCYSINICQGDATFAPSPACFTNPNLPRMSRQFAAIGASSIAFSFRFSFASSAPFSQRSSVNCNVLLPLSLHWIHGGKKRVVNQAIRKFKQTSSIYKKIFKLITFHSIGIWFWTHFSY